MIYFSDVCYKVVVKEINLKANKKTKQNHIYIQINCWTVTGNHLSIPSVILNPTVSF